jgi:hypothetical protein
VFDILNNNSFFVKLFDISLDSIKNKFCHLQGCSDREILVLLKRVGQVCLILCTRVNLVDSGQFMDKNNYGIALKLN